MGCGGEVGVESAEWEVGVGAPASQGAVRGDTDAEDADGWGAGDSVVAERDVVGAWANTCGFVLDRAHHQAEVGADGFCVGVGGR